MTEHGFWSKAKPESIPSCGCTRAGRPIPFRRQSHRSNSDRLRLSSAKRYTSRSLLIGGFSLHAIALQLGMCNVVVTHRDSSFFHGSRFVPSRTKSTLSLSLKYTPTGANGLNDSSLCPCARRERCARKMAAIRYDYHIPPPIKSIKSCRS
jgi:hypothetical protein